MVRVVRKSAAREPVSLNEEITHLLNEARMVLPGIQALFGFQLIAIFNSRFEQLPAFLKYIHIGSLLTVTASIVIIMTPAAYHRIAESHEASRSFAKFSSILIALAMVPLGIGISLDVFVTVYTALDNALVALIAASVAFAATCILWFMLPLVVRHRRNRARYRAID